MPFKSHYPDVEIPEVDLWSFIFSRPKEFPGSKVIYRSATSDRYLTFDDVRSLSLQFSRGLLKRWNFNKGDVIVLYTSNVIDVPPIIYGVLAAGGIVSPANPTYSTDELAFQLTNSGAKAIVSSKERLQQALQAAKKAGVPTERVLVIDEEHTGAVSGAVQNWRDMLDTQPGSDRQQPKQPVSNTDLAFLVYSSGTTGLPKGVMLSHRNIVAQLLMMQNSVGRFYDSKTDKMLAVLPFFHIYGLTALVNQALHRGIEQIIMPSFELTSFCELIQRHKITFTYVAPPVMVRLGRDDVVKNYDLSSLKMITCGAAPLSKELVDIVYKRLGVKANQAYGLSETSPMTHAQPWDEWYKSVGSVGKILPNLTARCMSSDEPPVEQPVGVPGELWVRGPNVFQGYWQNAKATAECMTTDGFFKTGDVGYMSAAGDFYITDRVKELIKYKGFQVAPAELEGKLLDHPEIMDVAVIGVDELEQRTEVPRAYVVARDTRRRAASDGKSIEKWLEARVAPHKKLRGGVKFVDEIPKSATGKILRRILKDQAKKEQSSARPRL